MKDADFYNKFEFNIYKFNRYHHTDNSKTPLAKHYFGCLIEGTAKIKTQNEELLLMPNEIFYIPKGLKYQSFWFGENEKYVQFYSFGFEFSPSLESYVLQKIKCSDSANKIFSEMCEQTKQGKKSVGKLYYFFDEIADDMKKAQRPHVNTNLQKAIDYMTYNPTSKISDVAKHCNVSVPGIYSLFKRKLNKTPNYIRNQILCEKAVVLLTTTNKSVQEISDFLNFSSTSYFRKVIRTHIGKTPLEIRKNSTF